jgi:hypothetical protein
VHHQQLLLLGCKATTAGSTWDSTQPLPAVSTINTAYLCLQSVQAPSLLLLLLLLRAAH